MQSVEFARDWKWFKRGQSAEMDRGRADALIRARICRPADAVPVRIAEAKPVRKRRKKKAG